ncbi:TPA: hypothetical protein N0F65_004263 [Lagenidium giganteum]|uniref:CUE domain-containing protein n=1 Tax=Lagenidium giganteum TaxID=4803 RepID=A0AAV2ZDW4_9STRA|nr:TPA: hypothetical protein N0F65_004263 [Lagenidium giganteum]
MRGSTSVSANAMPSLSRRLQLWDELQDLEFVPQVNPLATVASANKLQALREIYPTLDMEVLQDLLVAAEYRLDVAAQLASELVEASPVVGDSTEAIRVELDAEDEQLWSEAVAEPQQWVMVHDEWEVVDLDGERVRTFAEVLRASTGSATASYATTAKLNVKPVAPQSQTTTSKTREFEPTDPGTEEWCVKSFGARRRHQMCKRR